MLQLPKEIAYLLSASGIVGGSWILGVIVTKLTQRRKGRRIEQGLVNYLRQRATTKE